MRPPIDRILLPRMASSSSAPRRPTLENAPGRFPAPQGDQPRLRRHRDCGFDPLRRTPDLPPCAKQIFIRAGGNDLHGGRTPREVAADFLKFVRRVQERLPKTEILFIALSPAPARWGEGDKNRELNRLIRLMALDLPHVGFVDAYDISLTSDGRPRPELFVNDRLHFAPEGYKLLADRVRPFLAQ